jgi:NTP-dependent ternary system trypsin peptidase co-occuring protein
VPQLVEFPLEGGGSVFVEVDEVRSTDGSIRRGLSPTDLVGKADETVEAAFARVKPAAVALVNSLRDLVDAPDEIQLTFGIRLSGEVGAVIAKTSADANFEVQMSWKAKEA